MGRGPTPKKCGWGTEVKTRVANYCQEECELRDTPFNFSPSIPDVGVQSSSLQVLVHNSEIKSKNRTPLSEWKTCL